MSDAIRRRLGLAAALLFSVLLLASTSPAELARRVRSLSAFAPRELATRRLGGSAAAFDRRFFRFVESVRRVLPRGTTGVALIVPQPDERHIYLAAYTLAPVSVRLSSGPAPSTWPAASYLGVAPAAARLIARLPDGDVYFSEPSSARPNR